MRASALRGLTSCLARGAGPPHLIPRGPRSPPSPRKGEGWGGDRDPLPTANRNRPLPISADIFWAKSETSNLAESTSPFQGEVLGASLQTCELTAPNRLGLSLTPSSCADRKVWSRASAASSPRARGRGGRGARCAW